MTVLKKVKSDLKPVLCADFESIFESVESYEGFYSKISRSQSLYFFICNIAQVNHFVMYNNDN